MEELNKLNKYIEENHNADTYSEFTEQELKELFLNMEQFEKPDIVSVQEDKVIGIEHFEFDSYKNTTKKGSDYKFQDDEIKRNMQKEINERIINGNETEFSVHDKYENNSSLRNYKNNFLKMFESHYSKINDYKNNIKSIYGEEKTIAFWFFIEDVSPLGNYVYKRKDSHITPILPIFFPEIRDIFKQSKKITGIIFGIHVGDGRKLFLFKNDEITMKRIEEQYPTITEEFISFDTKTIGFVAVIPKEEIESGDNNE